LSGLFGFGLFLYQSIHLQVGAQPGSPPR